MRLQPLQEVATPGRTAPFICEAINSNDIQQFHWLVNGTRLEYSNLGDRVDDYVSHTTAVFIFLNVSVEYNDTTIQCIGTFTSGEINYSTIATLLVQGEELLYIYKMPGVFENNMMTDSLLYWIQVSSLLLVL